MRISTASREGRTEIMAASSVETGSGTGTKEYRAMQCYHAKLVDILSRSADPAGFARRLKEKSLITESKMYL